MVRYEAPEYAPWDGRRVPVTLLGGYLGAGKTTALNEVLARTDRPIAVLVNDVGEVNIDAKLVRRRHGDTIELTDGCVCCSLSGGLADAFTRLVNRPTPPDHVLMELSGIADPLRVIPWAGTPGFRLDGVIVLVDADQLDRWPDPSIPLETIRTQVTGADVVVLTKVDLVDSQTVARAARRVSEWNASVPVVADGAIHPASLLALGARRPGGITELPKSTLFDSHVVDTRPMTGVLDQAGIFALLDDLPPDLVRAKGIADGGSGQRFLIQVVGKRRTVIELPRAEAAPPTDLVTIRAPTPGGVDPPLA